VILEPESFRIKNEPNDSTCDLISVDRSSNPESYDCHGSVDPYLPTRLPIKIGKRFIGHEHDNDRALLDAELKAKRGRYQVVIAAGLWWTSKSPSPYSPPNPNPALTTDGNTKIPAALLASSRAPPICSTKL
jgi:hypothetical protein